MTNENYDKGSLPCCISFHSPFSLSLNLSVTLVHNTIITFEAWVCDSRRLHVLFWLQPVFLSFSIPFPIFFLFHYFSFHFHHTCLIFLCLVLIGGVGKVDIYREGIKQ